MGEHDLQVSLDTVRDKNVMQLKKLNCAIFPVTYQDKFYTDALTSGDFTKLGKLSSQFQKFCFFSLGVFLLGLLFLMQMVNGGLLETLQHITLT
jgi:hypothetical protein